MPFFYPTNPPPSSAHMSTLIDPAVRFEVDQGYSFRRALHSRPRRVIQLDYLGMTTANVRWFRDFIQHHRLTVTPFSFQNLNSLDTATIQNTTPVILTLSHQYMTGQWIGIFGATAPLPATFYKVTRIDQVNIALQDSTAVGAGTCVVYTYFPYAIGVFPEDRWPAPVKLMGPESANTSRGRYSWSINIEEIF